MSNVDLKAVGGVLVTDGLLPMRLASSTPAATFYYGQKTVAAAGTEEALAASQALTEGIVTIKALHDNEGMIYVGKSGVSSTTGFVLDAGEQVTLTVDNISDVFIDSGTNDDGVSWIAS